MNAANVHTGYWEFLSENLSTMGHSRYCSEEQHTLIKKLIGEGQIYKEVQLMQMKGCSAKIFSNGW